MSIWLNLYRVNWEITEQYYQQGILEDSLLEINDGAKLDWVTAYDDFSPSNNYYCGVAQAYEELRSRLAEEIKNKTDAFMLLLITFGGYHQDLDSQDFEFIVESINPKSVVKFAQLADEIDWSCLQQAYDQFCSLNTKENLISYVPGNIAIAQSFNKSFIPYIDNWVRAIYSAAKNKQGILVAWI